MVSKTVAATLDQVQNDLEKQASEQGVKHCKRPKSLRTKDTIRQEQVALHEKYMQEIGELLEAYYKVMRQEDAESIGTLYARHSSRFQDSITDQIRVILEDAVRKKVFIPRENVFFDIAIRGFKERRPGLIALKEKIASKDVKTFMVFATSRLYRRTYKSLQFVEEELVERNIRAIFVKSNIDTANEGEWRTLFQALAANDEAQVRLYGAHIQASHEGLFGRRMVHTSLSLGYTGEVVPGEYTRRQRPRRLIVVDPLAAQWIVKIFRWYVVEGIGISDIARKLNADPSAPPPAKSTTGRWSHAVVVKHLKNAEYRGWWEYGANETKWLSKKDYAAQVPRENPLKEGQFEELRVIPDDCWHEAQTLLAKEPNSGGRKPKDDNGTRPSNLLRGQFVCPEHGRRLAASGAKGRVLLCPACRSIESDERPLFTHLNRSLALCQTCEYLIDCLEPTDELVNSIIEVCDRESASLSESDPKVVQTLRKQLDALATTMEFNRRNPGFSDEEQRRTEELLKNLRSEQNEVLARLRSVETAMTVADRVPDHDAVVEFLEATRELLRQCLSSTDETVLRNGRRVIDGLTGGSIQLYQIGERVKSKGHLQGRFQIDTVAFAVERLTGMRLVASNAARDAAIDYETPMLIDEQSETAKRLWNEGLLHVEIARQMGCIPPYVTKLIQHWHDKRGLPRPNNKSRRKVLEQKQTKMPLYKMIANDVVDLMTAGLSNLEIARRLDTNDCNVAKAIKWWHETRGLPVPTSADRRQQKLARAKLMLNDGALLKDTAKELGYCPRGLKLALAKDAKESGVDMPDGRTRRGNASAGNKANGTATDSKAA